jgi:hypothetical protein
MKPLSSLCATLLATTLPWVAACQPSSNADLEGDVGRSTEAIINGEPAPDLAGVVALLGGSEESLGGFCSGAVIGPYAVLTAKHCVDGSDGTGLWVSNQASAVGGTVREPVPVREVRTTPGRFEHDQLFNGQDIAVLILRWAIDAPAYDYARRSPSVGDRVLLVGYGRVDPGRSVPGDFGYRNKGYAEITHVQDGALYIRGDSSTCQGDSGGPAFDDDMNVVGVAAFGREDCTFSRSGHTDVAPHEALIEEALEVVPPCFPTDERCNGADDDCNGIVDDRCTPVGAPCEVEAQCVSERCEAVAGERLCTRSCNPLLASPCDEGMVCETSSCGQGRCVPEPDGAEAGALCEEPLDCRSGHCGRVGAEQRCGRPCSSGGCADGLVCDAAEGTCGVCVPPDASVSPRFEGASCESGDQCRSGACVAGRCAAPLDCADGSVAMYGGDASAEGQCVPAPSSSDGGCAVNPPGTRSAIWLGLAAVGLGLAARGPSRRRRRRS